jgi:TonB family protein
MDQKWVEEIGRQHNHEVLMCYQDRLKANPKTDGELTMWIEVSAGGEPARTTIVRPVESEFDKCVSSRARDWKYPWAKNDAGALEYKFHVHKGADGQPLSEFNVQPFPDKFHVQSTINNHRDELNACAGKKASGKLVVEWVIGDKGEVTSAKALQSSVPKDTDNCVLKHVKEWKFPLPPKELIAKVRYPFFF